jgi:tetratricopeptide (TPR) repeat protein
MDDAICNMQKAVELTPHGHPDKPTRVNNLGNAFQYRFERLGNLKDMEDAISDLRKAVELTPDGHPQKPSWLSNLGNALRSRFERLSSLPDLQDAISTLRKAVELTPDGHPYRPGFLNNLGNAHQRRFECLDSLADLQDAICNQQKAVELTPDSHPHKPNFLGNLGNALRSRFERLSSLPDLQDAISSLRKAVELTPDGHPDKPSLLNGLGDTQRCLFERFDSVTDINDAISNQQKAVELTPDGRFDKPGTLTNLGSGFLARFRHLGVFSDLESALSAFSIAAQSTGGSAMTRLMAAYRWARVAEEHYRSPLDAFSCAINLLPRIAWLGLAVTDQHALLAGTGGIVRDAVAAAIRYEEYETAVVWAEQGRSIVWQNLLCLRNPADDLRRAHPRLADQLQNFARQMEGSASRDALRNEGQAVPVADVSCRHSKLAIEWDDLIDQIRGILDFEGFMKAKTFSQLAPAAHEGPVVILNVNNSQCDALVLIPDDSAEPHVSVVNIPLERFSDEKSKKLFQALTGVLSSAGVRERNNRKTGRAQSQVDDEAKFKRILGILWQDVVKPVIEGLAFRVCPFDCVALFLILLIRSNLSGFLASGGAPLDYSHSFPSMLLACTTQRK